MNNPHVSKISKEEAVKRIYSQLLMPKSAEYINNIAAIMASIKHQSLYFSSLFIEHKKIQT